MKNRAFAIARNFLKHELVSGSMYIFMGSILANAFNLFFNVYMSRNLTPQDYGSLISLISLITLVSIPIGSVIPAIINFSAPHFAKLDYLVVKTFFLKIIKPVIFISLVILLIFTAFSKQIGGFFKITDVSLIIIVGFSIAILYIGAISNALLQSKLEFKFISLLNLISVLIKVAIGVALVMLGLQVKGAMLAYFVSIIIPFIIGFVPLRFIFKKGEQVISKVHFKDIIPYGIPAAFATFGLASFISTDILLVKHFYSPTDAGMYAILSLIGKAIFYFTAPITTVMFPLIIQKHTKNEDFNNIFKMAVVLVAVPSILISTFYFVEPQLAVKLFIKRDVFFSTSNILGIYGIFITIYSLISLFVYYFLSIKKTKVYLPVIFSAILQAILINFYHSSLLQVILISIAISGLLLIGLSVYYLKVYKEFKKGKQQVTFISNPI